MPNEGRVLRRALEDAVAGRRGGERRYPQELRSRAASYLHEQDAAGVGARAVAAELGLPVMTLKRWARQVPVRFRPVLVSSSPAVRGSAPVLVTPGGYRIEGLALDDVAMLLRALA
jgi:transposase-like protein